MKKLLIGGLVVGLFMCMNVRSADALCVAARSGDMQGVLQALNEGVDVNAVGGSKTALSAASDYKKDDIVELLIMRGADVNTINYWHQKGWATPLIEAIADSINPIRTVYLLLSNRAQVNFKTSQGATALSVARESLCYYPGNAGVVNLLLEHKAQA